MNMRFKTALAALTVTVAATLAGCAGQQQQGRVGAWSDQWYRKGRTPEDIAKWERAHPVHPSRPDDSSDPGASESGGGGPY